MLIAAPIWLLALAPWAALVAWMLWGRRERVGVPFLALWRGGEARPTSSRAVHAPPLPIVLVLLTILLAILAASGPTVGVSAPAAVTVLVDRGLTMSARDGDAYRYQRADEMLAPHVRGEASVVAVPPRDVGGLAGIRTLPPTAVDTAADVAQAAQRLLATIDGPLIVLTDQPIPRDDPRLILVPPAPLGPDAGIAHVAARERPAPQVMVRVAGATPKHAVVVTSDGQRIEQVVDGTGFIDMPRLGKTVDVALAQGDALAANDRAWLVRESGWPRIEIVASPAAAELSRMVETYRKLRPAREDARVVMVVSDPAGAVAEAVVLAPATAPAGGAAIIADHPVTRGIGWNDVLAYARLGQAPPSDFTPVVFAGERVALAVRENPRQVWVAIETPTFPTRADYVVFWTNVFDWLGQGGDAFAAHPIGLLGDDWQRLTDGPDGTEPGLWPGVYQRRDGTLRAVNAPHVKPQVGPISSDWRERLARASRPGAGGRALAPYLLLAALLCAVGAAAMWQRRRPAFT